MYSIYVIVCWLALRDNDMKSIFFKVKKNVFKDKIFVTGFHGVGYTGWIALRHLIKEMNGQRIGFIYSVYTPPFVSMEESIKTPYEFYLAGDFIFFIPNIPFSDKEMTKIPYFLTRYLVRKGIKEAVLIGGLDNRLKEQGIDLKIAMTRKYLKRHKDVFRLLNASKIEEYLYIVGPLATMLSIFEIMSFPALTLLPYADITRPDPRAAAVAVQKIGLLYNVEINVKELLEEEERVLKEIEAIQKKLKQVKGEEHHKSLYV